uniref:Vesicle-fusing ATPase n=1 Tax=Neospora caninum (strain Liverpool) TaxID=572307 RepID=A0A0F7U630_NEOCL|nr:TPA: N-ethylmaleimide-sensitive factor, putative [Neospora caninum Liverpool]
MAFVLTTVKLPSKDVAFTNCAYVNPRVYASLRQTAASSGDASGHALLCEVKNIVVSVMPDELLQENEIGLNTCQRESARIQLRDEVALRPFQLPPDREHLYQIGVMQIEVSTYLKPESRIVVHDDKLEEEFRSLFCRQVFTQHQCVAVKLDEKQALKMTVKEMLPFEGASRQSSRLLTRGQLTEKSQVLFVGADDGRVCVQSRRMLQRNILTPDFNFEELGIGGLDKEFNEIFRRAFASRIFPPAVVQEMGIKHVRGMLLYGPPGTGKTLIARQIGKSLRAREPVIVNGPEILNKYVGQSEENIRNLFKAAEDEYRKLGDNASLHIIIFDEIDAICKQRGSNPSSAGVNDSIVNQLLSKIDGVEALNNILLIGMTNRIDMIDEALLRPGRLEVHIEIGLPDESGRIQILSIHTKQMRESGRLGNDVDLAVLAAETKNFSGAEIEGLVRSAASYAFQRNVNVKDLSKPTDVETIKVTRLDFENALTEVKPAFGAEEDLFDSCLRNGIISYGPEFDHLLQTCTTLAQQVRDSENTQVLSILLHGPPGCGKTALAAHVAKEAQFPFMKLVTPDNFVGFSEAARTNSLSRTFDDAYKSPLSLLMIDNIERLIDFTPIGPRFSNAVLQALVVLVKKMPAKENRRLLILATTSEFEFMKEAGVAKAFNVSLQVPLVRGPHQIRTVLQAHCGDRHVFPPEEIALVCESGKVHDVSIKQLLLVTDMAKEFSKPGPIKCGPFLQCLHDCGYEGGFDAMPF